MLNPPRTTGSPGVSTVRCREYPGVLALATLLAEVSKACWLTSSALKATESDPYNPDIASLLPAGESRRATWSGPRCKWAPNYPPRAPGLQGSPANAEGESRTTGSQ